MILSATGHRPEKLGGYGPDVYERLLAFAMQQLRSLGPEVVISGMALGWDTAIAEAAVLLDIPFHAYLPFPSQPSRWPPASRRLHAGLVAAAAHVEVCAEDPYAAWKMSNRNHCMVEAADTVLALYDGSPGGTANCVEYARSKGKPVVNAWSEWTKWK